MKCPEDTSRIPELWTVERVAAEVDVSAGCIWNWVRRGMFPRPIQLGPRTRRWDPGVVRRHVAELGEGGEIS